MAVKLVDAPVVPLLIVNVSAAVVRLSVVGEGDDAGVVGICAVYCLTGTCNDKIPLWPGKWWEME